jgi:hypothetical protein
MLEANITGEQYEGKLHVRFDEGYSELRNEQTETIYIPK